MTATAVRPTAPAGASGVPAGAQKTSTVYYDEAGKRHRAAEPVPVDQFQQIVGEKWRCRRCKIDEWHQAGNKAKGKAPVCAKCEWAMRPLEVKDAPFLPWGPIWDVIDRPLRPVWGLAGMVAAAGIVDASNAPAYVFAPAAVGAYFAVSCWWRRRAQRAASKRTVKPLDLDDPFGQPELRAAIDRAARACGYTAAAATSWLTLPAAVGIPADGPAGHVAVWGSLLAGWLVPAGSWWKKARDYRPAEPEPEPEVEEVVVVSDVDPDEAECLRIWTTVVAAKQGQQIGVGPDGRPIVAERSGKLVGTRLEDWRKVTGGWAATVVGPAGAFTAESFLAARGQIASAYSMKQSMITIIPDPEDENRAMVLSQRSSPIKETVRWKGPDSIDVHRGTAPVADYADGSEVLYELYRPSWGCPHDAIFGTTGSGKSELINMLLTIDRWAHFTDAQGVNHGIVADFLIDPQQGQSFAPFLDDLAAPVATSLDEAMLLVRALTAEMLRRNRYLAREATWWDEKRKKMRTGRKWWNPLVDGPLLVLTMDEAHDYLSNRDLAALFAKAGRMWRKCGGKLRLATHTPLLNDLGGKMELRDMITGGFVFVGRTANSLSGPIAFNGRLPADPRMIPPLPGTGYILTGLQPKAMLARAAWEPDYYDWVRDHDDQPVGYPAVVPPVTLGAFGGEYARWVQVAQSGELWAPDRPAEPAQPDAGAVEAVVAVLGEHADRWLDMDDFERELVVRGTPFATRTVRDALSKLRKLDPAWVESADGRHHLTSAGVEQAVSRAEAVDA